MKSPAIIFALALSATTSFADHPIKLSCVDDNTTLLIGLSPAMNEATLHYQSTTMKEPFNLSIYPPSGSSGNASVRITSEDTQAGTRLTLSGSASQVFRVTDYKNFSFTLDTNAAGDFIAKELTFQKGIDAFPDTQLDQTISFDNLRCTLSGL